MRFSLVAAALVPVLSASAANILVQVGANDQLRFSPQNITANVGDTIAFQFQNKNHSVTQSTFANPCAIQTTPAQGINSGFQFVAANATELPEWSFTVNNASTPLWFFCAQTVPADHCAAGMVFSVNAVEDGPKNFAAYQALAQSSNAAAAAGSAAGSAIGAATSAIASEFSGATAAAGSAIDSAAGAAATGAANALTDAANAITGLIGGASPTSSGSSSTPSNSGARVGGSALSLVAAIGLAALLL